MNNNQTRLILIVVVAIVFGILIMNYNSDNNNVNGNNVNGNNVNGNNVNGNNENVEGFYADGEETEDAPNANAGVTETESEPETADESDPMPSEGENNEVFKNVEYQSEEEEAPNNVANNVNRLPNECYPKDTLTPKDLLPQDSNSTWAQTVPSGQGSLGDQNFLNAGFHVGINTVGQSLRNANMQLRSEPANPQVKVSPWLQTTIEPDNNRRALEIGA